MAKYGDNIRQRKDGRWEGRYIKARTSGNQAIWDYVYGRSFDEVRDILIQRKAESSFYRLSGRRVSFAELAEQWLCSVAVGVKESTAAHYRYTLKRYLLPVFGDILLHDLDEQRLEQGLLQVISPSDGSHKPLGTSSARECLVMLRRICKYAAHLRLIRPVEIIVGLPQEKRPELRPLSLQEQSRVQAFALANPMPRKIGLLLQLQLGLRIGEVCGLRWEDFDLKAGIVTIRRTVSRIYDRDGHTKVVVQTPKTRRSGRALPIPQLLLPILRKLQKTVNLTSWFLSGKTGKPVEPRCYRKSIQGYLRRAAVRKVHPHLLRHTFATTCLQAGCDVKTLSEMLGHTDVNVTLNRYVHSDLKRMRKELRRTFAAAWKIDKQSIGCARL